MLPLPPPPALPNGDEPMIRINHSHAVKPPVRNATVRFEVSRRRSVVFPQGFSKQELRNVRGETVRTFGGTLGESLIVGFRPSPATARLDERRLARTIEGASGGGRLRKVADLRAGAAMHGGMERAYVCSGGRGISSMRYAQFQLDKGLYQVVAVWPGSGPMSVRPGLAAAWRQIRAWR